MNRLVENILKISRGIISKISTGPNKELERENDANVASDIIYKSLISDKPCMIARFGAFEISTVVNYLGVKNPQHSCINYIIGKQDQWWWNDKLLSYMQSNAGFYPATYENAIRFGELMLQDAKEVDILGSWQLGELALSSELSNAQKVHIDYVAPFFGEKKWSRALAGKKVLVVHPFVDTIKKQYAKRELLFEDKDILPEFDLRCVKAVQSINGDSIFKDWFEALDYMKTEIDKQDYDICLLGCGAYGFPLAAHIKRTGKKAIHIGGRLQLLFGIIGNRWDTPESYYHQFFNDSWCRPSETEKPKAASNVEGACYW